MRNLQCSKREFMISFIEGESFVNVKTDLINLIDAKEEYEFQFAIHEEIDSVLDLKPGESFVMSFNRDNNSNIGTIKRTK